MIKICFIYSNFTPEETLNVYRKMTPGCSGQWKDMVAVTNIDEADYCVIIDSTTLDIKKEKKIYISAHPTGYRGSYIPTPEECVASINYIETSGFVEWWLKYDYDYLVSLKCPKKTKKASCIISNAKGIDYQKNRCNYMERFCSEYSGLVDLYGRIKPTGSMQQSYKGELGKNTPKTYWFGKEVLIKYKYSLEFDAYCKNYFSERVADALLMWTMPLYSGGWNLENFIPQDSFRYLDLNAPISTVADLIKSDEWDKSIKDIEIARDLILNKLQVWPKVYDVIKSL